MASTWSICPKCTEGFKIYESDQFFLNAVYTFNGTSLYLHFKKSNKIRTKLFGKKYYCKSLV